MRTNEMGWLGVAMLVSLMGCGGESAISGTGGSGAVAGGGGAGGTTSGKGGSTGSGGSSAGSFTTSIPGSTKLTSLTSAQATQLCGDLSTYASSLVAIECANSANAAGLQAAYYLLLQSPSATDAELQAACALGESVDAGVCGIGADGGATDCGVSQEPATCDATVSDLSTCASDTTSTFQTYFASLPKCSSLTAASVTALFAADGGATTGPVEPPSCSKFDATCDQMDMTSTSKR